jgi:putative oxidoreductase
MIKKLLYIEPASYQTDIGLLILRIAFSLLMMRYGLQKIENYTEWSGGFLNFLGLGGSISLGLVIFAEFFCSILVLLGTFTRFALIPLIITMLVAFFQAHANDTFDVKEHPLVFLFPYITLLFAGAGRYSLDFMMFGKRRKDY